MGALARNDNARVRLSRLLKKLENGGTPTYRCLAHVLGGTKGVWSTAEGSMKYTIDGLCAAALALRCLGDCERLSLGAPEQFAAAAAAAEAEATALAAARATAAEAKNRAAQVSRRLQE